MSTNGSESRSALVLELAEEFLESHRAGCRPSLKQYIERHPELAAEIREVFPAMAMLENIAVHDDSIEAPETVRDDVPELKQLGDYRVLREIGRGGMGVVYEAEQISLGRHVALKVLPTHVVRDEKTRRRFEREARAAAKLHHTNIVPVFGVGEEGDTPYYVMQFIQGQGLDAVLEELKRLRSAPGAPADQATMPVRGREVSAADVARSLLTGGFDPEARDLADTATIEAPGDAAPPPIAASNAIPDGAASSHGSSSSLSIPSERGRGKPRKQTYWQGVARIGEQVADALAHAHAQGVIHRDIKPSNLLLDTRGVAWVTDFGLAKADDGPNLTHTGDVLGTLRYMPPEAFAGKSDARSDVYSLGLTLYEMSAFRPAFDERERARLVRQVTDESPPPLRKLNPEIPRDLETIVHKAIEREAQHRYANGSELADDLRRFIDDEPIRARRASVVERLARWSRRNPALAGLSATVALLLLSVIAVLLRSNRAFERSLERETTLRGIAVVKEDEARRAAERLEVARDDLQSTLYSARMNLAQIAWDSGNRARTRELLDLTAPKAGEPDLRGFEWHYWRRMLARERSARMLPGYSNPVYEFFSPDGELVATVLLPLGSFGGSAKVWVHETKSGRTRREFRIPPPSKQGFFYFTSVGFSADGKRVGFLVGYTTRRYSLEVNRPFEMQALVYEIESGRELLRVARPLDQVLGAPVISLDAVGSRVAFGQLTENRPRKEPSHPYAVWILDVSDGREITRATSTSGGFRSAELSRDGRFLATADLDGRVLITEIDGGRARFDSDSGKSKASLGPRFSPDARRLAAVMTKADGASELMIVDLESSRTIATERFDSPIPRGSLRYSSDGRFLIVANRGGFEARVFDADTGRFVHEMKFGDKSPDDLVVRKSDGRLLTLENNEIREWDLPTSNPTSLDEGKLVSLETGEGIRLIDGGRRLVIERQFADDLKISEFEVHETSNKREVMRFPGRVAGPIRSTGQPWSPYAQFRVTEDGQRLAGVNVETPVDTPRSRTRLRVWDLKEGRPLLDLAPEALGGVPYRHLSIQAWNTAGTRLLVGVIDPLSRVPSVAVVEVPSGRILKRLSAVTPSSRVVFRPDGNLIATATTDFVGAANFINVDLIDPESGQIIQNLNSSGHRAIRELVFSPDGRRLAVTGVSGGLQGPILIWSLEPGASSEPLRLVGHSGLFPLLAFSPDGRRLASAADVSSGNGGELKIWDLSAGGELMTLKIPQGRPADLAFDASGRRLTVAYVTGESPRMAGIVRFDAGPPAPEAEALELVKRIVKESPLKSEWIAKIKAEPEISPEVRAAALDAAEASTEIPMSLMNFAHTTLRLDPEKITREHRLQALNYLEHFGRLIEEPDFNYHRLLGGIQYLLGRYAEALESLKKAQSVIREAEVPPSSQSGDAEAYLAMTLAKLGRRPEAEAELAKYRELWRIRNPGLNAPPRLLDKIQAVFREEFGADEPASRPK